MTKTEIFINKAKVKHGNTYSYEQTNYTKSNEKLIIICKKHGQFLQSPNHHLQGMGCKKCAIENNTKSKEDLIIQLNLVHKNKYDFGILLKDYKEVNKNTKVDILCPKCYNEFSLSVQSLLLGRECSKCKPTSQVKYTKLKKIKEIGMSKQEFAEHNSKEIFKKKLSFINISFPITNSSIIKFKCNEHGVFEQNGRNYKIGKGCPICIKDSKRLKHEDFIEKANIVHNYKYNYENSKYINMNSKILIKCPIHGNFNQKPNHHLEGMGCKKCSSNISNKEKEIYNFLKEQNTGLIIEDNKMFYENNKRKYELDIYIPELKLGIEYNGNNWHCEQKTKSKFYHLEKFNYFKNIGIRLINVYSHEWNNSKDIIKNILLSSIGIFQNRIMGRKCQIIELTKEDEKKFLEENHLQGYIPSSSISYGLIYENNIVSCMTFGNSRFEYNKKELLRYCNKLGYTVIGGAEKLLTHYKKNNDYSGLISYCDMEHFDGGIYHKLGFKLSTITKPSYYYFKIHNDYEIYSRQKFQKNKIKIKFDNFEEELTEYQNMLNNGYDRVWNCGNYKFILE